MTRITVESTFTAISGTGKVELGDLNVRTTTVGEIEERVLELVSLEGEPQFWWMGYLLDDPKLTLIDACVGVSGERLSPDADQLVLFLTLPLPSRPRRESSFDLTSIREEILATRNKLWCSIS